MRLMRTLFLLSLGGCLETVLASAHGSSGAVDQDALLWLGACAVSGIGWSGAAVTAATRSVARRVRALLTGQTPTLPKTDPKAMAAEMEALNAQLSALRDTATSFDLSFDQTLQRLDERLRRLEHQSAYVQVGRSQ